MLFRSHCLADLSLWLRLLGGGSAYYHAVALSEYRVHRGQEQRGEAMGIGCITERLDLANEARRAPMTREQALHTLGLEPDATEKEIDAALAAEELKRRQGGLNGSDHAIAARIDAAREILRGKEGS